MARGGTVRTIGKPGAAYYRHCLEIADVPPRRVLAIGDHLETDIAGATASGIDSVLIRGGMVDRLSHSSPYHEDDELAAASRSAANERPSFELAALRW